MLRVEVSEGALRALCLFDLWEGAVEGVSIGDKAQREVQPQVQSTGC